MTPTDTTRPSTSAKLAPLAIAALLAVACGDSKRDPAPIEPTSPAADKQVAPDRQSQKPTNRGISADDPLLGTWEVIKATGKWAESNEGMTLSFEPDGKLIMSAISTGDNPTGRFMPHVDAGEPIVTEWTWRRTGTDSLELSLPDDPSTAYIETKTENDTVLFSWNKGAQIFTLKRIDQGR